MTQSTPSRHRINYQPSGSLAAELSRFGQAHVPCKNSTSATESIRMDGHWTRYTTILNSIYRSMTVKVETVRFSLSWADFWKLTDVELLGT